MDIKPHRRVPPAVMPRFDARYGRALRACDIPEDLRTDMENFAHKPLPEGARYVPFVREISAQTGGEIWQQMELAAAELDLPEPQHIYCVDSNVATAFADIEGQNIIITQGMCEALDRDALRAILRHELEHLQQEQLPVVQMLEDDARAQYDPAVVQHAPLMPYSRPHAILSALESFEDEAIRAEACHGMRSEDATRALEQLESWNCLLKGHTAAGKTYLDFNPSAQVYAQVMQPHANAIFGDDEASVTFIEASDWKQFVAHAPRELFFQTLDMIDEVVETDQLDPSGQARQDRMPSHPTNVERTMMHDLLAQKASSFSR